MTSSACERFGPWNREPMRPTLKTRKPIDTLDAADLAKFPIWELASDEEDVPGRDETWVRPVDASFVRMGL